MKPGSTQMSNEGSVLLLEPADVFDTIELVKRHIGHVATTILDPWYNKGIGGTQADYQDWLARLLQVTSEVSDHIFLWGFPEIVCKALDRLPAGLELTAWLTWYYKNCPSVVRGWRSAQYACLHFSGPSAKLYPEHFLNEAQLEKKAQGKLRYIPGPLTVIEAPLLVGFVGRNEQTGHPAQKPCSVFEPLLLMTTKEGDIVLDPMCGSGTTGEVCRKLHRKAILCDSSEEYTELARARLDVPPASSFGR